MPRPGCRSPKTISVFGDGEQTRDFFYVADLVRLLLQGLSMAEVPSGAVNVGLNQATSLNQLLVAIEQVLGGLPAVTYAPARSGDIRHSRADNRRLLQHYELGAITPLATGLAALLGR